METNDFELRGIEVVAGKKHLLSGIDWTIRPGERWLLFGRNGSGKTTLLTVMAGFQTQTAGDIKVRGESYGNDNVLRLRRGIGLVSGSFYDRIYNHESVRDIVLSGLHGSLGLESLPADDDVATLQETLATFDLKRFEHHPFELLSKGERQRVLIARALIAKPRILLLDEPWSGLDISSTVFFMDLLQKLVDETDMSIVYVTHRGTEILPAFSRAMLLRDGRIVAAGATGEVMCDDNMRAVFGFDVRVQREGDHYAFVVPEGAQTAMGTARTGDVRPIEGM